MNRIGFNMQVIAPGTVALNVPADSFFQGGMSYHFVSEFGQNTQDAARLMMRGSTAHLVITRKLVDRAPLVEFDIDTLERHALACEGDMGGFTVGDKVEMLLVEDASGGLDGNVTATSNDTASPLGRFLFEKGSGIHGKNGRAGGRFGLGSTVGTFMSDARGMFIHALRRDGTSIGSARLSQPTHEIDGQQFCGDARLGILDENGNWQGILHGDDADRLAAACGMSRPLGQAGLSCAIPYCSANHTFESFVTGAISGQYYQIAMGFITVTIIDEIAGRRLVLDKDGLRDFLFSHAFDEIKSVNSKKSRNALDLAKAGHEFILGLDRSTPMQRFAVGEKPIGTPEMRKELASGKALHVVRELTAEHQDNGTVSGEINVFIRKIAGDGVNIRVRDGIVVTSKAVARGMCTLTIAADDDIADLIGDGENPSHTDWTSVQARKRRWTVSVAPVFAAFSNTAVELLASLSGHEEESDRFSLAGFFPMPGRESVADNKTGTDEDDAEDTGDPIPHGNGSSGILDYSCDHKTSTLTITLSKAAKDTIAESGPLHLAITAEYDKSPRNAAALVAANGFINVTRGASEHTVETTPKGQRLTVPKAMADLRIVINIDMVRDISVHCELIDTEQDHDMEDAA